MEQDEVDRHIETLRRDYHQALGRLSSRGMARKAAAEVMPGCAPVGYKNTAVDEGWVIVVDEEKALLRTPGEVPRRASLLPERFHGFEQPAL